MLACATLYCPLLASSHFLCVPWWSHVAAAPAGAAGPVTDATWKELVLESKVPVLVDFWAPWCGPCRMIAPLIDEIAQEYGSKIVAVRAPGTRTVFSCCNSCTVPNPMCCCFHVVVLAP